MLVVLTRQTQPKPENASDSTQLSGIVCIGSCMSNMTQQSGRKKTNYGLVRETKAKSVEAETFVLLDPGVNTVR
jgi:hypothetical protein